MESNGGWSAALVHLAGGRRGVTEHLRDDRITIGSSPEAAVRVPGRGNVPAGHHATLERRGGTYELAVVPGHEVWVNGEQVDHLVLASGDVIELGRGGPVLRFRRYPPGRGPFKTVGEAFSDCWDCARYERGGALKKIGVFLKGVPSELAFQTSRTFRLAVVTGLTLLTASTAFLVARTARVERNLSRQAEEVRGLAGLLDRSGPNPATEADTRRMLNDLRAIRYAGPEEIRPEHQVPDDDNIVRIHGVHPETIRRHYDLYRELMHGPGPLSRIQRELIAVAVSAANGCHY